MSIKLFDFKYKNDFGHDLCFYIIKTKKYSLFQLSLGWFDSPGLPYLQIHFGNGRLIGALFWAYKFGFDFDFFGRTWHWYNESN